MNSDVTASSTYAKRPLALAIHLLCATQLASLVLPPPSAHAQQTPQTISEGGASSEGSSRGEVALPAVTVTAGSEHPSVITQDRVASVGKGSVSIQDTPFSIDVIDMKQATEAGAKNIQDALLYSAGVFSGQYGFDTRGDWSSIRGLSPSAYIDGLRGLYGYYNNVRPEVYTLESIEVLKGPSSVLYGQAELGGIINVVTKRPSSSASREIEVQLGSHERKQVAADLAGPITKDGNFLYRLVALKRDSDTQVDYVNDDAVVFMPSITWKLNADTSLTAQYIHQKNDSKVSSQFLPQRGTLESAPLGQVPVSRFVGEPGWDRYDTEKDELSIFWDQRLSEAWKLAATVRKTDSSSITREIYASVGPIPDNAGNITRTVHTADRDTDVLASDIRIEGKVKLGPTRHTLAFGIDYQNALWEESNSLSTTLPGTFNLYNPVYGNFDPSTLTPADAADNKIIQTGFYAMDHMEWGPWVLSAAVRNDRARNIQIPVGAARTVVRNNETTGRLGLMYRFANGVSPYISKSTAFSPNLGTDGAGGFLEPTTGDQVEAGIKYLSASGNTSAAFAWFDIKQKDRISNGSTPGGLEQTGARTDGWEVAVRHRMGPLELLANYTDLDAIDPVTQQRLASVPEKTASAWAQYLFNTGWRVGVGGRYAGDVTGSAGQPIVPSVTLYDAMVGYMTGPWDFRLNVQNISDKEYVSWCRGLNLDCGYGEGRNVMLTANYKF